ncbi:MAG: VOC family protein [Devosia sp.]
MADTPPFDAIPLSLMQSQPVKQVAIVVRDLEASCRAYWEHLRIGPWTAFEYTPAFLKEMTYMGQPAPFSLRHALAWKEGQQFELIQPLEGPSIFADHLAQHGEGLHHVGIYVPDHARAVAEITAAGFACLQSAKGFGATGDGAFAYFASPNLPGAIIELIGAPTVRREPLFVYPRPEESQK